MLCTEACGSRSSHPLASAQSLQSRGSVCTRASPGGHSARPGPDPFYVGLTLSSGEGNGTPLQGSCLESPRDGGAWWVRSLGSHRVGHD